MRGSQVQHWTLGRGKNGGRLAEPTPFVNPALLKQADDYRNCDNHDRRKLNQNFHFNYRSFHKCAGPGGL